MHDFSDILHATQQKLALLAPNISYFDWETFGDRGSPCYRPYAFPDSEWEAAEALTLAADILRNPAYPESEFDQLRMQAITGLEASRKEPSTIAGLALAEALVVSQFEKRDA